MSKEIQRRSAETRRRRRSVQIRFATIIIALTVMVAWIVLFLR